MNVMAAAAAPSATGSTCGTAIEAGHTARGSRSMRGTALNG